MNSTNPNSEPSEGSGSAKDLEPTESAASSLEFSDPTEVIQTPGPWEHRYIAANGARFHVVVAGEGPFILLLHGFPTFWWTWRNLMPQLVAAGYRVAAMDLRGYGGSDHPPHGYDPETYSLDAAGVIRALGEDSAVIIGHDVGGWVSWAMPAYAPDTVRAVVPIAAAHPLEMRRLMVRQPGLFRQTILSPAVQLPFVPERRLAAQQGARVEELLRQWSVQDWLTPEIALTFRAAMLVPHTIHCAVEFHRWVFRSFQRNDGRRFARTVQPLLEVPVLQIGGAQDPLLPSDSLIRSTHRITDGGALVRLQQVGHFPHEEAPDVFWQTLQPWLAQHA